MNKEEIGKILKETRINAGLTQAQVAERLGKRQQAIGNWETGYSQPDINSLLNICSLYGISLDAVFLPEPNSVDKSSAITECNEKGFLEQLDLLMKNEGINKNQLSARTGIPVSTIYGWYK